MAQRFALRFLSGRYQGGDFEIPTDRDILIGRASTGDIVLIEDMVSRRHARVGLTSDQLFIEDLSSTNGTFVNGEKVTRTQLREGDRILIGTSILRVVLAGQWSQPMLQVPHQPEPGAQAAGTLEQVSVPDLLQLFGTSRRTGVLQLEGEGHQGRIYFRDGDLYYAAFDENHDLGPMKALCRLVGWRSGSYAFGPSSGESDFMLELEDSTENLVTSAIHEHTEFERLRQQLPSMEDHFDVPRPLPGLLSGLPVRDLEVFQLVYDCRRLDHILDRSPSTDFETAASLLRLVDLGFIHAR
ncbi:MAG: FHA domain-containing protein [Myxococcota bacterium]